MVNINTLELVEPLDEAGFRHVATSVAPVLRSRRIYATVYEAEAGFPIWPYHYHHGVEEWLYVIAGAPVLREPAGERTLAPGDLVRFPTGPLGAHTVKGPGRFVIFSAGQDRDPWMSVYPDSDKVSGPEGILLRSSAVGYFHNEGTSGPREPDEAEREPDTTPPPLLEATVIEDASEPYHYVYGRDTWLLVLTGTPTLRRPDGEDLLEPGDLVCFSEGPAGAHQLLGSDFRALLLSTTGLPANVHYPDTGEWLLRNDEGTTSRLRPPDRPRDTARPRGGSDRD
jgi:uncharacterized cupin superfamily protein